MHAEVVRDFPAEVSPESRVLNDSSVVLTQAALTQPSEVLPKQSIAGPTADTGVISLARFAAHSVPASAGPKILLPESLRKGDGVGPVVALDKHCGKLLVVTVGITDVVERTGLTVSVWGTKDQDDWGGNPLVTFRQRQYCGVYSVLLNLARNPDILWLRAHWNMNRWGKGERTPSFGFQIFLEESGARVSGSVTP